MAISKARGVMALVLATILSSPLFAQENKKPAAVDEEGVRATVARLSSSDAAERDKAMEDLKALDINAVPLLTNILKKNNDPEVKWRVEYAIKAIEQKNSPKTADNSQPQIGNPVMPADEEEMMKKAAEIRNLAAGGGMANPEEMMKKAKELSDLAMRNKDNFIPDDMKQRMEEAKKMMGGKLPEMKGFDNGKFNEAFKRRSGMGGTFEDLSAGDTSKLGLGKDEGAVKVKVLMSGGVGEKAGLKNGDIIVEFNGKKLPAEKPLNALREIIKGVKPSDDVPIVVIRDGKKTELKAKWSE